MSKLTEKELQFIKPSRKDNKVFDEDGLRGVVRVRACGLCD
jgi:hypothetical protein